MHQAIEGQCLPTDASLISTCLQTVMNNHSASLGVTCDQYVKSPSFHYEFKTVHITANLYKISKQHPLSIWLYSGLFSSVQTITIMQIYDCVYNVRLLFFLTYILI